MLITKEFLAIEIQKSKKLLELMERNDNLEFAYNDLREELEKVQIELEEYRNNNK